jgi:HlyD family secretion protein
MSVLRGVAVVVLLHCAAGCSDNDGEILVGMLERDRIAIPAELSEPVTALYVREGAAVAAGDRILQLDDARALAERARLAALASQAQRRVDELVRGPREENIREAHARLSAAEGQLQNARHEFERVSELRAEQLASASALDAAKAALDARQGERDATRANLEALLEGTTVEELDQARAQLAAAEAALRVQELLIERLTVVAPRAARVEALPYKQGAQPPRGAEVAVLLADGAPYARVYIPAAWRETYVKDAVVTVRVTGFGDYPGRVRWVAASAAFTPYFALTEYDRDRLSYAAEIELGEGAATLPAGVPVEVHAVRGAAQ